MSDLTQNTSGDGGNYPTGSPQRLIQRLEDAASGGLFVCEADREEAVEIAAEEMARWKLKLCPEEGSDEHLCSFPSCTCAYQRLPYPPPSAAPAAKGGTDPLIAYLKRQWAWSKETFGPALRTKGIVQHITKELREIEADPHDLAEWVDVIILAMDGFWRHGGKPSDLLPAMQAKQDRNFARTWPDWRTMGEDQAIEHDRSGEASPPPPAGAAGGGSGDLAALSAGATKDNGCILCCNGAELPPGESCRACGRVSKKDGLLAALNKLEGPMSPPTTKVAFAAPTPDLGAQGEPVACDVPDSVRRFIQHCEEKVYPLVTGCWALNRTQADAFIDALNAARADLAAPAAPRSGSAVTVEEIAEAAFIQYFLHNATGPEDDWDAATIAWSKGRHPDDRRLAYAIADSILALLQAPRPGETGDGWEPIANLKPQQKAVLGRWQQCGDTEEGKPHWYWQQAAGRYFDYLGERHWCLDGGDKFEGGPFYGSAPEYCHPIPAAPSQPHAAAQAGDGGGE